MNKIGFVFCALALAATASSQEYLEKFTKAAADCRNELNAADDDLEVITKDSVPQNRKQACMLSCFGTKTGIFNSDGTYKIDESVKLLEGLVVRSREAQLEGTKEKLKTALEFCNRQQKKDIGNPCDAAKEYQICYAKKAREIDLTKISIKM